MAHVMKYLKTLSLLSSKKTSWCETKKSSAGGYVIIFHSKISLGSHTHTHKHTTGRVSDFAASMLDMMLVVYLPCDYRQTLRGY